MSHGCFFSQLPKWKAKFHKAPELPFSEVLSQARIEGLLKELNCIYRDRLYTPCVTLWMFLSQVLDDDHSCRGTVGRLLAYREACGLPACSTETTSYCQARIKLPEELVARLARDTGRELSEKALDPWRWHNRKVKVADGTTASMPDTPENTKAFGKPSNQKGDCGFPVARIVMVLCLATGGLQDMAIGPYCGKRTGELSLFRSLKDAFEEGDIVLADRLFCTFCDIARLKNQKIDVVFRLHAHRSADFRRGQQLGPDDHVVIWHKPTKCPDWLTEAEFAELPSEMKVREVRVRVAVPGFRVRTLVVVTTLLDSVEYSKQELAKLYRQRWHGEVDLRSLKSTLQMDVLRCKTPAMVRKEIWMHTLAGNLLRSAMCAAAVEHKLAPRQISFRGTQQMLKSFYSLLTTSTGAKLEMACATMIQTLRQHIVGDRPNRYEPRKRKRQAKPYPPLKRSRDEERKLCRKRGSA